jgi:hypothetical protein
MIMTGQATKPLTISALRATPVACAFGFPLVRSTISTVVATSPAALTARGLE